MSDNKLPQYEVKFGPGRDQLPRDLAEAILQLQHVMQSHNLSPIVAIELGSIDDFDVMRGLPMSADFYRGGMVPNLDRNTAVTLCGVDLVAPTMSGFERYRRRQGGSY